MNGEYPDRGVAAQITAQITPCTSSPGTSLRLVNAVTPVTTCELTRCTGQLWGSGRTQ